MNERLREWHRVYRQTPTYKAGRARIRQQYRKRILDLFGRRCVQCGYDTDERALQTGHIVPHAINSRGLRQGQHGRSGFGLYMKILSGVFPKEDFQILCANCNFIKRLSDVGKSQLSKKNILTKERVGGKVHVTSGAHDGTRKYEYSGAAARSIMKGRDPSNQSGGKLIEHTKNEPRDDTRAIPEAHTVKMRWAKTV